MSAEHPAANFDDRAEPAQATPAGGVAKEVPHDGRASATPPSSAAQVQKADLIFQAKDRIARVVVALQDGSRPALERLAHEALDLLNQVKA